MGTDETTVYLVICPDTYPTLFGSFTSAVRNAEVSNGHVYEIDLADLLGFYPDGWIDDDLIQDLTPIKWEDS